MPNPFLTLDELRQRRNEALGQKVDSAVKVFGDMPLTLEKLRQAAIDRDQKAAQAANVEARAAAGEHRAQYKFEDEQHDEDLKAGVGGQLERGNVVNPLSFEENMTGPMEPRILSDKDVDVRIVDKMKKDPKFADTSEDEIRNEIDLGRSAKDKTKFERAYKGQVIDLRKESLRQGQDRIDNQVRALDLSEDRNEMSKDRLEWNKLVQSKLPEAEAKQVIALRTEEEQLEKVKKLYSSTSVEPGLFEEVIRQARLFVKHPDPKSEEGRVAKQYLQNIIMKNRIGSAQTVAEIANTLAELPDTWMTPEAFEAEVDAAIAARQEQRDSILYQSASLTPATQKNPAVKAAVDRRGGVLVDAPPLDPSGVRVVPTNPQKSGKGKGPVTKVLMRDPKTGKSYNIPSDRMHDLGKGLEKY